MKNKIIKILTILIIGIVSFFGFNQIVKAEEVSWTPGNYINIDSATSSNNTAYYLYESATIGINYHNPSIMKIKDNEYVRKSLYPSN